MPVEAGSGIESLLFEELRANFVEGLVVALDVAQIAGGADDVFPRGALGFEQVRDVLVGPPGLGAEIADVDGSLRVRPRWRCRRSAGW